MHNTGSDIFELQGSGDGREDGNNGFGWGRDDVRTDSGASYQFTISGGTVTGEDVVFGNGHTHTVSLSSSDSFTVGTGTVTETVTSDTGTATIQFSLESGSTTNYQVTERSFVYTDPTGALPDGGTLTYGFTISGTSVTGETETITFGGQSFTRTVHIPDDAVLTTGFASVTEDWVSGNQVRSVTYNELAGGKGVYVVSESSSTLVDPGSATTLLDVKPDRQAMFTTDSSGNVTAAEFVNPDGHTVTVSADQHIAFTVLATGYVEETKTWGSHSSYIVYYDGSGHGTYTDVAHGSGTTVDLVGLKAQIAELPAALATAV